MSKYEIHSGIPVHHAKGGRLIGYLTYASAFDSPYISLHMRDMLSTPGPYSGTFDSAAIHTAHFRIICTADGSPIALETRNDLDDLKRFEHFLLPGETHDEACHRREYAMYRDHRRQHFGNSR